MYEEREIHMNNIGFEIINLSEDGLVLMRTLTLCVKPVVHLGLSWYTHLCRLCPFFETPQNKNSFSFLLITCQNSLVERRTENEFDNKEVSIC